MGRDAQKSAGNVWREARLRAAEKFEALYDRERVAELLGVGIDAVRRVETNANKTMPVDTAVLMADLYNAPELLNHYCLHECPIGCNRPISSDVLGIDRVTVKLLNRLNADTLEDLKVKLLAIADDGRVSKEELPELSEVISYLNDLSVTLSELRIIGDRVLREDVCHGQTR